MRDRVAEIDGLISTAEVPRDQQKYRALMKERAHLSEIVEMFDETQKIDASIHEIEALISEEHDGELKELAEQELLQLRGQALALEEKLSILLMPRDPFADKAVIMEIRAGTGGEEAALFAADLYRMYTRYADSRGWNFEVMNMNETELVA